jgi:uncharacterized protein (TIGR00251 family)
MPDVVIAVRVTPRSARDEVTGWQDGALRVRLRAPPVDGKANEALRRLLADRLGVALSAVTIVGGETARLKRVRVGGMDEASVRERLG